MKTLILTFSLFLVSLNSQGDTRQLYFDVTTSLSFSGSPLGDYFDPKDIMIGGGGKISGQRWHKLGKTEIKLRSNKFTTGKQHTGVVVLTNIQEGGSFHINGIQLRHEKRCVPIRGRSGAQNCSVWQYLDIPFTGEQYLGLIRSTLEEENRGMTLEKNSFLLEEMRKVLATVQKGIDPSMIYTLSYHVKGERLRIYSGVQSHFFKIDYVDPFSGIITPLEMRVDIKSR